MNVRSECVELYAAGDRIAARCTLCGGQLSRDTPPPPDRYQDENAAPGWNLWDLTDAMNHHMRGNHS